MLKADYTPELIEFVQHLAKWEVLNQPTVAAIQIAVTEKFWDIWITKYNIWQIVRMQEVDFESDSQEDISKTIIRNAYDKNWFIKTYKRQKELDYIKKSRILGSIDDFLEHLNKYLESYKPREFKEFTYSKKKSTWWFKIIALTDLHVGKKWTEAIKERMDIILDDICSQKLSEVYIFSLWDLVETLVQWWMHDWQSEGMETYWFDLIMEVVSMFENFLYSIASSWIYVNFYWVSGNHDRISKNRDWDKARLWGLVIYELIKRWLSKYSKYIKINILREYITTINIQWVNYILAHWDVARIPSRSITDIAWKHWDNTSLHNVIMHWHLHTINIKEEKGITKIWLPGLAGKDEYATKELDLHSEPGYVELTHNRFDTIDINIKRLPND